MHRRHLGEQKGFGGVLWLHRIEKAHCKIRRGLIHPPAMRAENCGLRNQPLRDRGVAKTLKDNSPCAADLNAHRATRWPVDSREGWPTVCHLHGVLACLVRFQRHRGDLVSCPRRYLDTPLRAARKLKSASMAVPLEPRPKPGFHRTYNPRQNRHYPSIDVLSKLAGFSHADHEILPCLTPRSCAARTGLRGRGALAPGASHDGDERGRLIFGLTRIRPTTSRKGPQSSQMVTSPLSKRKYSTSISRSVPSAPVTVTSFPARVSV